MQQVLINLNCLKKNDLASLKSEADIGKLEKVATCLNSLKRKLDKLNK